ncbi:transcriptional regulatory protein dcuR [Novosphingobium sp. MD-1]|nr:transcriptional regulatory protein dcuR [Novosphingobium sp. MD-1]
MRAALYRALRFVGDADPRARIDLDLDPGGGPELGRAARAASLCGDLVRRKLHRTFDPSLGLGLAAGREVKSGSRLAAARRGDVVIGRRQVVDVGCGFDQLARRRKVCAARGDVVVRHDHEVAARTDLTAHVGQLVGGVLRTGDSRADRHRARSFSRSLGAGIAARCQCGLAILARDRADRAGLGLRARLALRIDEDADRCGLARRRARLGVLAGQDVHVLALEHEITGGGRHIRALDGQGVARHDRALIAERHVGGDAVGLLRLAVGHRLAVEVERGGILALRRCLGLGRNLAASACLLREGARARRRRASAAAAYAQDATGFLVAGHLARVGAGHDVDIVGGLDQPALVRADVRALDRHVPVVDQRELAAGGDPRRNIARFLVRRPNGFAAVKSAAHAKARFFRIDRRGGLVIARKDVEVVARGIDNDIAAGLDLAAAGDVRVAARLDVERTAGGDVRSHVRSGVDGGGGGPLLEDAAVFLGRLRTARVGGRGNGYHPAGHDSGIAPGVHVAPGDRGRSPALEHEVAARTQVGANVGGAGGLAGGGRAALLGFRCACFGGGHRADVDGITCVEHQVLPGADRAALDLDVFRRVQCQALARHDRGAWTNLGGYGCSVLHRLRLGGDLDAAAARRQRQVLTVEVVGPVDLDALVLVNRKRRARGDGAALEVDRRVVGPQRDPVRRDGSAGVDHVASRNDRHRLRALDRARQVGNGARGGFEIDLPAGDLRAVGVENVAGGADDVGFRAGDRPAVVGERGQLQVDVVCDDATAGHQRGLGCGREIDDRRQHAFAAHGGAHQPDDVTGQRGGLRLGQRLADGKAVGLRVLRGIVIKRGKLVIEAGIAGQQRAPGGAEQLLADQVRFVIGIAQPLAQRIGSDPELLCQQVRAQAGERHGEQRVRFDQELPRRARHRHEAAIGIGRQRDRGAAERNRGLAAHRGDADRIGNRGRAGAGDGDRARHRPGYPGDHRGGAGRQRGAAARPGPGRGGGAGRAGGAHAAGGGGGSAGGRARRGPRRGGRCGHRVGIDRAGRTDVGQPEIVAVERSCENARIGRGRAVRKIRVDITEILTAGGIVGNAEARFCLRGGDIGQYDGAVRVGEGDRVPDDIEEVEPGLLRLQGQRIREESG